MTTKVKLIPEVLNPCEIEIPIRKDEIIESGQKWKIESVLQIDNGKIEIINQKHFKIVELNDYNR